MNASPTAAAPDSAPRKETVFANRNFLFLFTGQLISNLGNSFFNLALLWLVKELTGSAAMMGAVGVSLFLPLVVFGPVAGVIADRFDRKKVMIASDLMSAAIQAALIALYYTETLVPWHIMALGAMLSTSSALFNPAKQSIIVHLVPKSSLTQANSFLQLTMQLSQTVGPILSGLVVAAFGVGLAFIADAASFLISALFLMGLRVAKTAESGEQAKVEPVLQQLKEGFQAVRGITVMMAIMPLVIVVNLLFSPIQVLLPLFVDLISTMGAQGLGMLQGSIGIGMLIGSLLMGSFGGRLPKGRLIIGGFFLLAVTYTAFSLSQSLWQGAIFFGLLGLANPLINIPAMTMMQEMVPAHQQGRVFALVFTGSMAAQPVGTGVSGVLGEAFGVRAIFVGASLLTLVTALAVSRVRPLKEAV